MDGRQALRAHPEPRRPVAGIFHHRVQRADRHRRAELFSQCRRTPYAGQEGSAAARFAVFQVRAEVTQSLDPSHGVKRTGRAMQALRVQDVVELLRDKVQRTGSQSQFARQNGVAPSLINRVLKGERLPPSRLCRALGLEWVLVSRAGPCDSVAEVDIVTFQEFIRTLRMQINKAGGIAAWGRQFGIDRSHLSSVLHKRRPPDQRIIAALNLAEVLVDANDPRLPRSHRTYFTTNRKQPNARWKKKPRFNAGL